MKQLLIIGNWKLHGNKKTINQLITALKQKLYNNNISKCLIIIAPPIVYLDTIKHYLVNCNIKLCAQNVDIHESGAFTGEISPVMLFDLGVQYVLLGHSERRQHHQENDIYIAKKFAVSKKIGLTPILCIGENKEEYNSGQSTSICIKQIHKIIELFGVQSLHETIIAYEPIWSIGSGYSALPKNVQTIHNNIRNYIAKYNISIAKHIHILYGGSVNSKNIDQFLSQNDIDGVLVGNASLNVDHFFQIIQNTENFKFK